MDKSVYMVVLDCAKEAEAIRQCVECFGAVVRVNYIGRPSDFVAVLENKKGIEEKHLVICGHGENGGFCLPELDENIYAENEPHGTLQFREVLQYLKLENKMIVSTCCTTGCEEMKIAFEQYGNTYLAPRDYPSGAEMLMRIFNHFYRLFGQN